MFAKKLVSVVLCLVLLMASVVALIPEMIQEADAATYRSAANGASSSYKGSKYYKHYQMVTLSGDNVTDTLALALSQLGYHEGSGTGDMDGISSSNGNYTEFNYNMGDWGSGYTYEWCATFCSWALYQSYTTNQGSMSDWCRRHKNDSNYIWREVGCGHWVNNLKSAGVWKYSQYYGGSYKPQPGDLIFFRSAAHIGMVVYSDSTYVYTIEGNTSDAAGVEPAGGGVFFKKYALNSSSLDGYGALPYKRNSAIPKIDYSGANPTPGLYVSNAVKYVYSTETGSTRLTDLPKFTVFQVTEIASNGRLKATFTTSSGSTVTGWILNNSDRVIQMTTTATEKVSMTLKCVDEAGNTLKTETISGYKGTSGTITPPAITNYVCTQSSVSVTYTSGATVTLTYKTLLDSAIANAASTRYCDYTPAALATLRTTYDEAVALQNNSGATVAEKVEMASKLQTAIDNNIYKETVLSKGKTYTTSATERTDKWADDGKKLTDGTKGNLGSADGYSGWGVGENGSAEIVVDLGAKQSANVFRIYTSINAGWGINLPAKFDVFASDDNSTWSEVGTAVSETTGNTDGTWTNYTMEVRLDKMVSARYVKFVVTAVSGHVWLEEVEVASAPIGATGEIYINKINAPVSAGDAVVFTPAFGEISETTANHKWTFNILVEWDNNRNIYVVKEAASGTGSGTKAYTLSAGQLLFAFHSWESDVTDPVYRSVYNRTQVKDIAVGDYVSISRINVATGTLGATAGMVWESANGEGGSNPPSALGENLALNKGYTTSTIYSADGVNPAYPDENGKTMTDGLNAAVDGKYNDPAFVGFNANSDDYKANGYAYITVDLGSTYTVNKFVAHVASAYNADAGVYAPSEVIVLVSNDNSTWTEAGKTTTEDINNASTLAVMIDLDKSVSARYVQFRFVANKSWIMVAEVQVYEGEAEAEGIAGDVNADGKVDSADYIIVKRACFNSYVLSADEESRSDVDNNAKVDSTDYVLVKRIAFGTY